MPPTRTPPRSTGRSRAWRAPRQLAQEVYGLAAEVFADLARSTGGDPRQLSAALDRAKSDPAGFAAMLRPETLDRLRALATRISDAQR